MDGGFCLFFNLFSKWGVVGVVKMRDNLFLCYSFVAVRSLCVFRSKYKGWTFVLLHVLYNFRVKHTREGRQHGFGRRPSAVPKVVFRVVKGRLSHSWRCLYVSCFVVIRCLSGGYGKRWKIPFFGPRIRFSTGVAVLGALSWLIAAARNALLFSLINICGVFFWLPVVDVKATLHLTCFKYLAFHLIYYIGMADLGKCLFCFV